VRWYDTMMLEVIKSYALEHQVLWVDVQGRTAKKEHNYLCHIYLMCHSFDDQCIL